MSRLNALSNKIAIAMEAYYEELERITNDCTHEDALEAPYRSSSFIADAEPPFRVCTRCGRLENGWGCGYELLKDSLVRRVTRREGYAYRNKLRQGR